MDLRAEIDRAFEELEWEEFPSILEAAIYDVLAETPNPLPPPTTPPPPVPAELELNADPQPPLGQGGAHGGYIPLGTDPYMMAPPIINQAPLRPEDVLQPSQLYSQADAYSQGQYLPYQWPVDDNVTAAAVGDPAAPPQYLPYQWPVDDNVTAAAVGDPAAPPQYLPYQWPVDDNVTAAAVGDPAAPSYLYGDSPVFILPTDVEQNLRPVGALNGHVVYEMPAEFVAPPDSVVPPVDTSNSKRRKRYTQPDDGGPYIKKPPNAFMLYMREQRPNVEADIKNKGNAAVNVVLGQRWKSLTEEEKAKYYKQADEERLLHAQRHPEWSGKNNYGKKRKRSRRKAPTNAEASSSAPEEHLQQAKRRCVTPTNTTVIEASTSQAEVMMEPYPLWTMAEEDFQELLDLHSHLFSTLRSTSSPTSPTC